MSAQALARYREQEDDAWSVDSSHTDTSSIVQSPSRSSLHNNLHNNLHNSELYSRLSKAQKSRGKFPGPQLLRQGKALDPRAPVTMAQTVVVLPKSVNIPLPKGVSFDPATMSFQGIDDVDMSGFDDSEDEFDQPSASVSFSSSSASPASDCKAREEEAKNESAEAPQRNPTPLLSRKKTPPPPLRPPTPSASADSLADAHNRRSSMSEFVMDEAMREALFESQRRHNVMLMALVGFEDYQHILSNGRRLLNEKFVRNVQPRTGIPSTPTTPISP